MVVLQTFIKTAAVSGIAFFWVIFTAESLKLARHIIFSYPWQPIVKQKVMCESCHGYFLDDGGELIHGKLLCESCSDDLVRDELKLEKNIFLFFKKTSLQTPAAM